MGSSGFTSSNKSHMSMGGSNEEGMRMKLRHRDVCRRAEKEKMIEGRR